MLVPCNCSARESYGEILPFKRLITLLGEIGYMLTNITMHECYYVISIISYFWIQMLFLHQIPNC